MNNELSKNLMCIMIRGGVEVWIDSDKMNELKILMQGKAPFLFNGEILNPADVSGVFKAATMEERTRRKNGQSKCKYGWWHNRFEQCAHRLADKK